MMDAVVLAGGRGTRLAQYVPELPKPMAPVAGRPFLEHVLDQLVDCGVVSIVLSIGYLGHIIEAHFGNRYRGAMLRYAREEQPLGTGGAIAHALQGAGDVPVLVVNGDTLLKAEYREIESWYQRFPVDVAMVLRGVADVNRFGAAILENCGEGDERVSGFGEKSGIGPGLINAGVYILRPPVFASYGLEGVFSLETDLLQRYCAALRPRAYITDAYFVDIGIPADLDRARMDLVRSA